MSRGLALGAVLLATAAHAIDVKYGVGARSEVRTRTPLPGDLGTVVTGDLELDPTLDLTLLFDTSALALQYAPTLIWREPQTGGKLLPLQRGRVGFTHAWSKAQLTVTEDGAWGLADIGALRNPDDAAQTGAVNAVQTLGGVPYLRSATSLTLDGQLSGRVSLGGAAGFSVSGSPAGTVNGLPLQYGPTGALRLRWLATRLDALTTGVTLFGARFDSGAEQLLVTLTQTWERPVSRTTSFSLAGGAALTRELVVDPQVGPPGTHFEGLPVGSASVNWSDKVFGTQPVRLGVSARLTPFADRFTTAIYERLEGRVQGDWKPGRDWAVTAAGSAALAVGIGANAQAGDRLLSGEAAVTWTAQPWLLLQASARVLWTEQPRLNLFNQVQAVGVVAVTIREQDSVAW